MGQRGFGALLARDILFRLLNLYGKPTIAKIGKAISRLSTPMDRLAPVKVMLCDLEEV